jgi:hypothetical protein
VDADVIAGPPGIVVGFSTAWAHVSVDDDVAAWAFTAAREMWALPGAEPARPLDVEVLAAEFEVLARAAFVRPCSGAFVLCPDPSHGPRAVLRLTWLPYPLETGDATIVEELLLPAERQLLPPQVEFAGDPGLRRIRIRQRAWSAGTGVVSDHIGYVFPCEGGAWTLSTSLPDPLEAERWLADLDQLAAGAAFRAAAG